MNEIKSTLTYFNVTLGDKFEAKVISGSAFGIDGPVTPPTPIQYIDFHLEKGASLAHSIPASMNALVYIYRGEAQFGPNKKKLKMFDIGVLDNEGGKKLEKIKIKSFKNKQSKKLR